MEIKAFLPDAPDTKNMDIETFFKTLAQARTIEQMYRDLIVSAVQKALSKET